MNSFHSKITHFKSFIYSELTNGKEMGYLSLMARVIISNGKFLEGRKYIIFIRYVIGI